MARIFEKTNDLKVQYEKYEKRMRTGVYVGVVAIVLWAMNIFLFHFSNGLFLFVCFASFPGGFLFSAYNKNKVDILKAGIEGEESTKQTVMMLPDEYCAVPNVTVSFNGNKSELDMVVVGPSGVFIIETKNHGGVIKGNAESQHLMQLKVGQGGTPYSSELYNPIKQVGTHTYRLANYLKSKGVDVWVQGMVYFSNISAEIELTDLPATTPVYTKMDNGATKICKYILGYQPKEALSPETVNKIVKLIY